jgi:hypothetical protein
MPESAACDPSEASEATSVGSDITSRQHGSQLARSCIGDLCVNESRTFSTGASSIKRLEVFENFELGDVRILDAGIRKVELRLILVKMASHLLDCHYNATVIVRLCRD